ncbi:MAG TPA: protease pro-enzyme activation domain-containing protein, partial [Acidothermaceae bacterium]
MASRRLVRLGAVCALASGFLVATGEPAVADGADRPVAVGAAVSTPGDVAAVTAADPDAAMDLTVVLAPRDQAALDAFVAAVSTPGSEQYRRYLAPGEFGPRFGASPQAVAAVSDALRKAGLRVGPVADNGLSIRASGTVAEVGTAFHTSFKRYRLTSGRAGLANTTAPTLPASVAAHVQGVVGLDQLIAATSAVTTRTARAAGAAPGAVTPAALAAATAGP